MSYFKINNNDYSAYVSGLKISTEHLHKGRTNASGTTVVKYINSKRAIEVTIIPLDAAAMANLMQDINSFNITCDYLNPNTQTLETGVNCMIANNTVEYYTIQGSKTQFKAFTLVLQEL